MKEINIESISKTYHVRRLDKGDIEDIFKLSVENSLYYQYFPPMVCKESILQDMSALPPNKTYKDKYYLGFFDGQKLTAILDLIINYPVENTAFIGLLMISTKSQNKGIGSLIIRELSDYLKDFGFKYLRLAYIKENPQCSAFWYKNGFTSALQEIKKDENIIVIVESELK